MQPGTALDWTRHGVILRDPTAGAEGGVAIEPSVMYDGGIWKLWASDGNGLAYATADNPSGPWTWRGEDDVPAPAYIVNDSFEIDNDVPGLADGWEKENDYWKPLGTVIRSLVAGRTAGTFAQRIQYTAQSGDTGKMISLSQLVSDVFTDPSVIGTSVWVKGSVTGAGVYTGTTLTPEQNVDKVIVPTASWKQHESANTYACLIAVDGDVTATVVKIYIQSDSAVIDVTIDDFAMTVVDSARVRGGFVHTEVEKFGSTYYCWGMSRADLSTRGQMAISVISSADGINWDLVANETVCLTPATVGQWGAWIVNPAVVKSGSVYYMYFSDGIGGDQATSLATASAPLGPWTRYPAEGGVVFGTTTGDIYCNPTVFEYDGTYYMICSSTAGGLDEHFARAHSTDLVAWTLDVDPEMVRTGLDEGEGIERAQIVDVFAVVDGGTLRLFYTANTDFDPQVAPSFLKVASAPLVISPDVDIAALDAKLDAVLLKTNTIGALAVTVASPVAASGTITLSANDDYHTAHGRSIPFEISDPTHALGLDDPAASVELRCSQATWTATAVETTDGYHVAFEIPHAGLTRSGHYQLKCLLADGDVVTRAKGEIVLDRDIPAVG